MIFLGKCRNLLAGLINRVQFNKLSILHFMWYVFCFVRPWNSFSGPACVWSPPSLSSLSNTWPGAALYTQQYVNVTLTLKFRYMLSHLQREAWPRWMSWVILRRWAHQKQLLRLTLHFDRLRPRCRSWYSKGWYLRLVRDPRVCWGRKRNPTSRILLMWVVNGIGNDYTVEDVQVLVNCLKNAYNTIAWARLERESGTLELLSS